MIREYREKLGITQLEASSRIGMPVNTYVAVEIGNRAIPKKLASTFCKVLEIPKDVLTEYLIELHIAKYNLGDAK